MFQLGTVEFKLPRSNTPKLWSAWLLVDRPSLRENVLGATTLPIRGRSRRAITAALDRFTRTRWPLLTAPETLAEAERYAETSANFLKAFSSMNTLVRSYESANRQREAANEQFEMARAESERRVTEATAARERAEENARIRQKAEAEIERLNHLFAEEKSFREAEVARARKAAKREVTEEFAKQIKTIEAKLEQFDQVADRYMYFSQAKANAELIVELEEGKSIEDEKKEVEAWKEEFGDAEAEYSQLAVELLETLKIPPVSPDSAHDSLGNRSVEGEAIEVGVIDQAGTNLGSEAALVPDEEQDK
ncbi:uncharacterized protein At3g60930, chloroplastic-like [Arabidopsis lyrata subsp. lyrata]|uniref:uncharacterized protein At3g60930, chloroplastic-like n=1 Tax=Arabidopsis lyrata subsp. lyrata TaxID=81972 RepID=UPI000A29DF76|nr:uncharacterized protein At3g60930, chloroplastic-like [Arabidopsis lyrata subsp. lyrata]|eukprot:XP_020885912.1 uncharacterized protein At3g60930, chloroplastic-like [Arabidopsis lyrata subsp. lyrata]